MTWNALGIEFSDAWVPLILDGRKTQTIRKWKKPRAEAGYELQLLTRKCELIGVATCQHVEPIRIFEDHIVCSERRVSDQDALHIAQIDGFASFDEMRNYIVDLYKAELPFEGYRILWSGFENGKNFFAKTISHRSHLLEKKLSVSGS